MMEENRVGSITMSAIAKEAGIARSTLYQYYESLDMLIGSVSYDYASALFRMMREGRRSRTGSEGFREGYYLILRYAHERKALLRQLLNHDLFMEEARRAFQDLLFEDYIAMDVGVKRESAMRCAAYLASGGLTICKDWINSSSHKSLEEEADILHGMVLVMLHILNS